MVNKNFFFWAICLMLFSTQAQGILYPDRNIETMAQQAQYVFVGEVVSQLPQQMANGLWGMTTTLTVLEDWTGNTPGSFSFTQLAQKSPRGNSYRVFTGMPTFKKGQTVLLMLPEPSLEGFSSPIDLQAFNVFVPKQKTLTHATVWPQRKAPKLFSNLQLLPNQKLLQNGQLPTQVNAFKPFSLRYFKAAIQESRQ